MGRYGVNALDVGTGPGPAAFAIHDFYSSMMEFSGAHGNPQWQQPANVTCVEFDQRTNHLRHLLAETVFEKGQRISEGVLALCFALSDFGKLEPSRERKEYLRYLLNSEYTYFDEERNQWESYLEYLPDEANAMAGSLHRYRLITFSNFLTTVKAVKRFEPNLSDVLRDAQPGSVLLVMGGKKGPYPEIYRFVDELAKPSGFKRRVAAVTVSCSESKVAESVFDQGRQFCEYLQGLAENNDASTKRVREHFQKRDLPDFPSSEIRVYRKHRYAKRRNGG